MGEEEILEAVVFFRVGGEHEDDSNGDLLLPSHAEAWSPTFIRHVEALLHRPDKDRVQRVYFRSATNVIQLVMA